MIFYSLGINCGPLVYKVNGSGQNINQIQAITACQNQQQEHKMI